MEKPSREDCVPSNKDYMKHPVAAARLFFKACAHGTSAGYNYLISTYTGDFGIHEEHARRTDHALRRFYQTAIKELEIIDPNAADNFAVRYKSLDEKL